MTTNDATPPGTPPLKIDHPDNRENAFQGQRFAQIVPRNAPPTRGISPPELPPDFRLRLIEQYRQRQQATRALAPQAPGISTREAPLPPPANNWIPIGPSVVRHGQAATRPAVSGRINGIAVAQNAAVVYAASANGGVWRSDDQGHSWRSTMEAWDLNPTTFASDSLSCGAIVVAPSDPYRVYVGTGEPYGAGDSYNGVGPIRSDDGGQNWITEQTDPGSPPLAGSGFYRLAVDPGNAEQVVAATRQGLYRREPDGAGSYHWSLKLPGAFTAVVAEQTGGATRFYAARWGGNIYSSSDGQTWNPLGKAFLPAGSFATIAGLGVQSGIVYALIANGNYHLLGVWRLNMQEGVWRQVSGAPTDLFGPDPNQQGQAWYDFAIAVDSSDPNRLYLGGSTKIAGGQWSASLYRGIVRQVNTASGPSFRMDSTYVGSGVHADIHTLVVTPGRPNQLWVGCDGGIFVSENAGGAGTFEPRNLGLSTMTLNHLGLHPTEDAVLFGGAQDNGTLRYTGDEVWLHSAAGDGGYAVINWHNPYEIIRSYTSATLERAEDGGQGYASYDDVSVPVDDTDAPLFYAPLAGTPPNFDPAHANDANVLAFGSLRPWISTTFGSSWQSIPTGISPGDKLAEPIQALTFVSAIRLYAGTNNGDIYRFDKHGATWTRTEIDGSSDPNGLPVRGPVTCITVDPADASGNSIFITLGGIGDYRHVWHYDGNAWQQRSGPAAGSNQSLLDVQHNAIVVDPNRPTELYAGADIGIWHSRDGGMTWETFSNGLPDAAVLDLKLQTRRRVLYAATHGRGVYTRTIDTNMALGVELYIRDTQLDLGRRPSEEGLPDPTQPGKTVSYTQSPDIKAVPPNAGDSDHPTAPPVDFFTFVDGLDDTSLAATNDSHTETINNYVYVQVHNRGVLPANNVQVMLLYSHTTGDAPPLPADYPIHVHDGTPIQTAAWKTLGIQILNDVRVGFPQVAAFELSSAMLPPATAALGHNHYLLAIIHSSDDHFTSSDTATHTLCINDRKVACKKIQVVTRPDLSVRAGAGIWANRGPQDALKAVALNPASSQTIVAAGANGIWKTTNGGGTWSKASPQVLNAPLRFDAQAASTLYGVSKDRTQILKSVNGGDTWSSVYTGTGQLPALATDPDVAGHVFTGGSDSNGRAQILRSTDAGATWTQILPDTLRGTGAGTVQALAVVPGGNKPLLAAIQVGNDGFIALSSDSGSTWQRVLDIALQSGSSFIVGGAATIYAGSGATLMRSTDGGGSWTDLSAKLPLQQTDPATATLTAITNLLVNAAQPAWVYLSLIEQASGQQSIFASQDGGETWCGLGHPAVAVASLQGLALDAANRSLYAATASGIAQYTLQWPVQPDFRNYYSTHDGVRTLGYPISLQMRVNGYLSQYFEKGRLEDHQGESNNPEWQFMAGLLVDELHNSRAQVPIGGDTSTLTYASLHDLADPARRVPPPAGYTGWGSMTLADGTTFIPFTADLRGAPGHLVLGGFWTYMNRADLFPGGWLHDIGLPISESVPAQVTKNLPTGTVTRMIMVQAFQRTILTYDALNPSGWQIERANIGTDYRKVFPERAGP